MKKLIILAFMVIAATAFAQKTTTKNSVISLELWSKDPSKGDQPAHKSTLTQPEVENDHGIVNCQTSMVEIYFPEGDKLPKGGKSKCVVICPGGGYGFLAMNHEGRKFAKYLTEQGIVAAVLRYRMPGGVHQIPMEDVEQAFKKLRENSCDFGIDTTKIGIMGFSAGGHLASTASVRMSPAPAFSVLFYPVISFKDGLTHGGSRKNLTGGDKSLYDYYSNELQVTEKTPPTLIFFSADDTVVPIENGKLYYQALKKNYVDALFVEYNTGGHGWGFNESFVQHEDMKQELINWLNKR